MLNNHGFAREASRNWARFSWAHAERLLRQIFRVRAGTAQAIGIAVQRGVMLRNKLLHRPGLPDISIVVHPLTV